MTRRWHARELIDLVLDRGSWESWDVPVDLGEVSEQYAKQLRRAEERSGVDESVITGRGRVRGSDVAVLLNEFDFLAGSIGQAAAGRIVAAVRRATAEGLPLLASTASGGTRMQEGTPAFVRMIEISRALMDHRAARLPYLVHLRNPTTGGVEHVVATEHAWLAPLPPEGASVIVRGDAAHAAEMGGAPAGTGR